MSHSAIDFAGTVLGVGLGALADVIVLHEILQWHHMISNIVSPNTLAGLQTNIRADGFALALAWVLTVVGVALLWRAVAQSTVPWSTKTFVGSVLVGWGAFHVVDEILDHWILGLHHIKPGSDYLVYDLGFTAIGVLLIIAGWILLRARQRSSAVPTSRDEQVAQAAEKRK